MLIGEKPPAVAPLMTIRPISTGLIPYWTAKPSAIGATIATAPGTTAPDAVRTAVTRNITHGMATDAAAHRLHRGAAPASRPCRCSRRSRTGT